jgi:hypothetical protein
MICVSPEQKRMRKSFINLALCVDEGIFPDHPVHDSIYGLVNDSIKYSINKPICTPQATSAENPRAISPSATVKVSSLLLTAFCFLLSSFCWLLDAGWS